MTPEEARTHDRLTFLLERLSVIVATVAVVAAIVVMVLGAAAALGSEHYGVGEYLADLKALVLALAAVLIALELPAAIHRRLSRNGRWDGNERRERDDPRRAGTPGP